MVPLETLNKKPAHKATVYLAHKTLWLLASYCFIKITPLYFVIICTQFVISANIFICVPLFQPCTLPMKQLIKLRWRFSCTVNTV